MPQISQVGNHLEYERRLFMGSGVGGTGVQCGVDVGAEWARAMFIGPISPIHPKIVYVVCVRWADMDNR